MDQLSPHRDDDDGRDERLFRRGLTVAAAVGIPALIGLLLWVWGW